jgi:hypothetical protein
MTYAGINKKWKKSKASRKRGELQKTLKRLQEEDKPEKPASKPAKKPTKPTPTPVKKAAALKGKVPKGTGKVAKVKSTPAAKAKPKAAGVVKPRSEKPVIDPRQKIYREKLSCGKKKCKSTPTIPQKVLLREEGVIDAHRCPKCHLTYKSLLPLDDIKLWMPLIETSIFKCEYCGTSNKPSNWETISEVDDPEVKIQTNCKRCGKKQVKVISKMIWDHVQKVLKAKPKKP